MDKFFALSMLVRLEKHAQTIPEECTILRGITKNTMATVQDMFDDYMVPSPVCARACVRII